LFGIIAADVSLEDVLDGYPHAEYTVAVCGVGRFEKGTLKPTVRIAEDSAKGK
jgi:hypothetical protein